jgi:hypothetical protein
MSFLNQDNRLLFVHVYKNGGSSIVEALRECYRNDLAYTPPRITGIGSIDLRLDYRLIRANGYFAIKNNSGLERLRTLEAMTNGHLTVKDFQDNIPIGDLESFAVVRNPWSWQVSLFNYARKEQGHFQHGQPQYENFETYIRWRCGHEARLQSHYLESHLGGIGVKHLLRFESLSEGWSELAAKTGWKLPGLPHKNQSTYDSWKTYYTDDTAALVGATFDKDCHQFGYRFDD